MESIAFFQPSHPSGTAAAPPSKSMAHRLLVCAGLAEGESHIVGVGHSEDVLATMDGLSALGAVCRIDGDSVTVRGTGIFSAPAETALPCRECGSTLRFLIPLCLLSSKAFVLRGSRRLLERPLSVYEEICREQGLLFARGNDFLRLRGPLKSGVYTISGGISSQFISGLLFALPLLPEDSTLRLIPPVESRPYIDMTRSTLGSFGVTAVWKDERTLYIPGGQRYRPRNAVVEGDWSNSAFFLAMGVPVNGLDPDSLQGDRRCVLFLERLKNGPSEIDLSDCPDLGPVLFAFAAAHHGGRFTGTRRLRGKESDRISAMATELAKFGILLKAEENAVTVGKGLRPPAEVLDGHGDHRVVMALATLCVRTGGIIRGAEAVAKSFPDFFDRLRALRIEVEHDNVKPGENTVLCSSFSLHERKQNT